MRKFLIMILSAISALCFAVCLPRFLASAQTDTVKPADLTTFLPSSALQLYELKSPVSVSYSASGYMVISEHIKKEDGTSEFDRISVYNPTKEKFEVISSHDTIYNVTHAEEYGGYVLYLSNSRLYAVDVNDLSSEPIETSVTSSNFFSITGNYLITNTNNSIVVYTISTEGGLTFTKGEKSTHNFTTKNAFISQEGDVYYLFGGKLYCFEISSSTSHIVADVSVDVNYMAECNNCVYLSSSSGIYKVEKGANKTLQLLIATDNVTALGHLANPQGLTVMGGHLLVADPTLKCIQAINPASGEFTDFAITTESTADYRLTNNASSISLSENYAYVLDDGETKSDGKVYKRIVKVALDKNAEKRYQSFNLEPLYSENAELNIKYLACSDTHIAIYADKTLAIYEISGDTLLKIYSTQSESVTTLFYLDGEFYYTDYALYNFEHNAVNVHKLTLPTEDNELLDIKNAKINGNALIKGIAEKACVDIFGNVYMVVDRQDESSKQLIKLKNGVASELNSIDYTTKSIKTDFAGNVFILSEDNVVYKYGYDDYKNYSKYEFATQLPVKDIELNYHSDKCYTLSNACILITKNNGLEIENLSAISAKDVKPLDIIEPKFITVNQSAKLFKVPLNDYDELGNFNSITPISNPNPSKVYLVIAEIENYYLVSYSEKLVALVRKTLTEYAPNSVYDSALISLAYYQDFNISITDQNLAEAYITNDTTVFAKPLFDYNYKTQTLSKGDKVKAVSKITFNGVSMTLISDLEGNLLGYALSGYLTDTADVKASTTTQNYIVASNNGSRHFNNTLMILVIALTVTLMALFIEKKLLFDKENHNLNK